MVTQILCGKTLVENQEKRRKMTERQYENSKPNSARDIVKLAEKIVVIKERTGSLETIAEAK